MANAVPAKPAPMIVILSGSTFILMRSEANKIGGQNDNQICAAVKPRQSVGIISWIQKNHKTCFLVFVISNTANFRSRPSDQWPKACNAGHELGLQDEYVQLCLMPQQLLCYFGAWSIIIRFRSSLWIQFENRKLSAHSSSSFSSIPLNCSANSSEN